MLLSLESVNNICCYDYYNYYYYRIDYSCSSILLMSHKELTCGQQGSPNINTIVVTCHASFKILMSNYITSNNNLLHELSIRITQVVVLPI